MAPLVLFLDLSYRVGGLLWTKADVFLTGKYFITSVFHW